MLNQDSTVDLIKGLAVIFRPAIANNSQALTIYASKVADFETRDLETVIENYDGEKMPTPAELRKLVQTQQYRRTTHERGLLPAANADIWVCPACRNSGWMATFQNGNPCLRRCLVNGYHTLKDRVGEVEAQGKQDLIHWILEFAGRTYGMEAFDQWLIELYGSNYLSGFDLKTIFAVRCRLGADQGRGNGTTD